jgi:PAS domain S-box-containing protein
VPEPHRVADLTDPADVRLRDSEAQLRLALAAGRMAEVTFHVDGGVVHSSAFAELFGHSADRVLSLADIRAQYHPEDHDRMVAERAAVLASGQAFYEVETRVVWPDGQVRWLYGRGRVLQDDVGAPVSVTAVYLDATDRKVAERALEAENATLEARVAERTAELAESERRFRAIFETDHQLTGLCALDGTLLVANHAALTAIGKPPEEVIGLKMWDAPWWRGAPDEAARAREGLERARGGDTVRYEAEVATLTGRRTYDFSLRPIRDDAGRPTHVIAEARDITEQKQAEDALRQAQKMDAIGQLTGGLAHDFNNLLAAVVGSFDLIRRKSSDAERVRRFAEAGLQAAERGAKLTAQLLAFSRAQRIELKPLVASDLVIAMQDMLARSLGPMVRLHYRLQTGRAAVLSDPTQLEMAVLNLAINARDAMPDGGDLTISLALRTLADDPELGSGQYVELAVSDTGAGMPPDVAARALDPFFTTKGVGKGTGLGLSQVYGIARQAGGSVRIDTSPGAGTTVRVLLPRTEPPAGAEAVVEPERAGSSGNDASILVIDDDPDIRRMLTASLDGLGYRVLEAPDGPAGLDALARHGPDLMIVDFAMPGMNGAETARLARLQRPDLPIIFASGYADTDAIQRVAGADAPLLRKPFRIDALQRALEEALAVPTGPRT